MKKLIKIFLLYLVMSAAALTASYAGSVQASAGVGVILGAIIGSSCLALGYKSNKKLKVCRNARRNN